MTPPGCTRVFNGLLVLPLLCVAILGCQREKAAPGVLAKVGKQVITVAEYRRKLLEYSTAGQDRGTPQPLEVTLREKVLNDLIERQLLLDEAEARNVLVSPAELQTEIQKISESYPGKEFDKMLNARRLTAAEWRTELEQTMRIKKVYSRVTGEPIVIEEAELRRHYDKHIESYRLPEQVRALHILVDSEQNAFDIQAQLRKGVPFETLAREHSLGPEAQSGGNLGRFSKGTMPAIFDEAIFGLEPGKVSRVVSSEYGYHIFKLLERQPPRERAFEEVKSEILSALTEEAKQRLYADWLERKAKTTRVMRNRELLAKLNF